MFITALLLPSDIHAIHELEAADAWTGYMLILTNQVCCARLGCARMCAGFVVGFQCVA